MVLIYDNNCRVARTDPNRYQLQSLPWSLAAYRQYEKALPTPDHRFAFSSSISRRI